MTKFTWMPKKKEAELVRLKEAIRTEDQKHCAGAEEHSKKEDVRAGLEKQYEDTNRQIAEALTAKKVYNHMLQRVQKEQALLKEKLLLMDSHLDRKSAESMRKAAQHERLSRKCVQTALELEALEHDIEHEKHVRSQAHVNMQNALQARVDAKDRRVHFEQWRHEVALAAANEAFNASAGRLRKLYAIEKLAGNCLQKITMEQVDKCQGTEDGFQQIRAVTGLQDVMDIVHKFLHREIEQEQLKSSVKEAEGRLDVLRQNYEALKRNSEGVTFDPDASVHARTLYMSVEEHDADLIDKHKELEQSRLKLQQSTLQVEHMKRWANRMRISLSMFEDMVRVDKPTDLPVFYGQLERAVDKFKAHIAQQISSGKVQRRNMSQAASKEYHEASKLLSDKDFLNANRRVVLHQEDAGPPSAHGQAPHDPADEHQQERERCKHESQQLVAEANRKAELQRKKGQITEILTL